MDFNEKTIESSTLYDGKILKLKKDKVLLPNGKEAFREIVEHSGGSCVLCEKDGKILLVKQFRYAYKEELWEIPAGKINPGEDPALTAIRELEEEGGIRAESVELLYKIYPSPGYTSEIIYLYKAKGFKETKMHLDEDEFLSGKWFSVEEIKEMLKKGEIKDGKTLIALLYLLK